mgnify:CR=1 FL=1
MRCLVARTRRRPRDDAVIRGQRWFTAICVEARHPLAVGHYSGDGIVSAEAELDGQLGGMLSTRFHMELYPGPTGTAEVRAGSLRGILQAH